MIHHYISATATPRLLGKLGLLNNSIGDVNAIAIYNKNTCTDHAYIAGPRYNETLALHLFATEYFDTIKHSKLGNAQ